MTMQYRNWEIRMPWTAFDPADSKDISGSNGVYELADESGRTIYIGYAGGRALFGIRGKIADHFSDLEPNPAIRGIARTYRYEVTSMWMSRWVELLGRYREADGGRLPAGNEADPEEVPPLPRFTGELWHEWNRLGTPAEREQRGNR